MDTSATLLDMLRHASDDAAWNKVVNLYSPLIRGWLKRHGAALGDVDDVVQDVLTVLI